MNMKTPATSFLLSACVLLIVGTNASVVSDNYSRHTNAKNYPQNNDWYEPVFDNDIPSICEVKIEEKSVRFFRSRLDIYEPDFVRFALTFGSYIPNYTPETFQPFKWYWTYKTSRGLYPYLHLNIDYQILSFKLLNEKTLKMDPYIQFHVSDGCNLTMGATETTELIANQLRVLVSEIERDNNTVSKYQESYWCYLAETPGFRNSAHYKMGLYLLYQSSFINYKCCTTSYNYTGMRYHYNCNGKQMEKWMQCTVCPYLLGLMLFLYCPLLVCKTNFSTNFQRETDDDEDEQTHLLNPHASDVSDRTDDSEDMTDLIYLDGRYPKTFGSIFANMMFCQHTVAASRLKRLAFVTLCPVILFVQIIYYNMQMPEDTKELIAHEVPVGFLALLGGTSSARAKSFAPVFGGPVTMLVSYYLFGIVFIVLPRSLEDIIVCGIPSRGFKYSPLFLNAKDIKHFSNINVCDGNGYARAGNFLLCRFYTLFNGAFWKSAFKIQRERIKLCDWKLVSAILIPTYLSFCVIELFIVIIFYSVPVFGFIVLLIRGVVNTTYVTLRERTFSIESASRKHIIVSIFSAIVTIILVSQIIVYCYIAVVIFPTASFGYLFFAVVLAYYIFRLIRGFGAKYLELLCDTVEIISRTEEQDSYLTVFDGSLLISNFKVLEIKNVYINNVKIPVPLQCQRELLRLRGTRRCRLIFRNNTYGIPKGLFDYVVTKHLPVHQQALKVVFQLVMIFFFLLITISLTTSFCRGPVSEMSDVMHVVFIVTVGALPRVLEVVSHESSEHVYREIKLRRIEATANAYWQIQEARDSQQLEQHVGLGSRYNSIN